MSQPSGGSSAGRGGLPETSSPTESPFRGSSEGANRVRKMVIRAARVDSTVLICGESGVGKELVAREIHARSERRSQAFIPLNCAAIPEQLIESELFGHVAGAFTDARETRRGAFELADRGTLFLDEIGDLSPTAQPKLLRAIETGEVTRVGGEQSIHTNIRIIAATNHDLQQMSKDGRFRPDLYYRLRIIEIVVPPLRHRMEDVPELAEYFARKIATNSHRPFRAIAPDAIRDMQRYSWPGNVRELRAEIERALAMSSGQVLESSCFDIRTASDSGHKLDNLMHRDWHRAKEGFERIYVKALLDRHGGSVQKAAHSAGIVPRTLYKILERLGIRND